MKTLVIAEDEKLIRQGLRAIIQRAPIQIEQIIECKNGQEVLDVLEYQQVDVLFTDIRMPNMDGITLVRRLQLQEHKPEIVIISGYDDFTYAVEALRCGAREYILKPVHRDDIHKVLIKLEEAVKLKYEETIKEDSLKDIMRQQIKYILVNKEVKREEITKIEKMWSQDFFSAKKYRVYCCNEMNEQTLWGEPLYLYHIEGQTILIEVENKVIKKPLHTEVLFMGISTEKNSLYQLREAYEEAIIARKYAYIMNQSQVKYEELTAKTIIAIPEMSIEKVSQLIGTEKTKQWEDQVNELFDKNIRENISYKSFESLCDKLLDRIEKTYNYLINEEEFENIKNYYQFTSATIYLQELVNYLYKLSQGIMIEHESSRNKKKIQEAIDYIHNYYNKDLNMAMVSNYVSMNYSFFSQIFKEYTGINFVNYLKEVRVNKAKGYLANTDKKIAEISNLIGYENEKHFMKVFKSVVGVSPTEYRKNAEINITYE